MDWPTTAFITAITAFISAAGGWWLKKRRLDGDEERSVVAEWRLIVDRERAERLAGEENCQKRISRLEGQIDESQKAISRLFSLYVEAHNLNLDSYTLTVQYAGQAKRANDSLAKAGLIYEDVPELPPRPARELKLEAEFLIRNIQQAAESLKVPVSLGGNK